MTISLSLSTQARSLWASTISRLTRLKKLLKAEMKERRGVRLWRHLLHQKKRDGIAVSFLLVRYITGVERSEKTLRWSVFERWPKCFAKHNRSAQWNALQNTRTTPLTSTKRKALAVQGLFDLSLFINAFFRLYMRTKVCQNSAKSNLLNQNARRNASTIIKSEISDVI